MWDHDARRARIIETANLPAGTLHRELPGRWPVIRRPDTRDPENLEIAVPWPKRVLLKRALLQCRCLIEEAVVGLVRWTDGWSPPLRSTRDETDAFLGELLGVMMNLPCLSRSPSSQ